MTRQEFINHLAEIDNGSAEDAKNELSNEDYYYIELVYTYHPAISNVNGKTQIAGIYMYGGMGAIRDMVPTAITARDIESQLQEIQHQKSKLLAQLEELKSGKTDRR